MTTRPDSRAIELRYTKLMVTDTRDCTLSFVFDLPIGIAQVIHNAVIACGSSLSCQIT
ncbi:hypothetical protein PC116_g34843 [Phytophthora cactorum]|nr:hypothetical protein PC116_g34843 [Phytophthora cactorum]